MKSQNLIQNPSFEYSTNYNCQGSFINYSAGFPGFGFHMLDNWIPISSPDYYHNSCNPTNYGVPISMFGNQNAIHGGAYAGLLGYYATTETKEYIQQHLTSPLINGKSYYVSFYVSRVERVTLAIKELGAYFSVAQPTVVGNTYFPAIPQIINQTGFLADTIGWTKIEGYFTAQGGEEYITIGNFNSNANTDTLYIGTTNPLPSEPNGAYYYIDSVSLYDSLDYVTGLHDIKKTERFSLFPNPNNGSFNLEYKINTEAEFVITDVTGRLINHYILFPSQNNLPIKEEELTAGVYFYYIRQDNHLLKQDKIVIIK